MIDLDLMEQEAQDRVRQYVNRAAGQHSRAIWRGFRRSELMVNPDARMFWPPPAMCYSEPLEGMDVWDATNRGWMP